MHPQFRLTVLASAVAACLPVSVFAQQAAPAKKVETPANKVEINAAANSTYDPRRDDTASKIVVSHDEIIKYGDTSVLDVLKRVPGVTVSGGGGRMGGEVRMRGLGSGYTQILINGERAPAGFSMDSLSPDVIERIEVLRAASAEFSTQSIAGTINIVLRRAISTRQRELKAGYAGGQGLRSPNANLQISDRMGTMSYSVALNAVNNRFDRHSPTVEEFTDKRTGVTSVRESDPTMEGGFKGLNAAPRINWNLANGDTLTSQSFINLNRLQMNSDQQVATVRGLAPAFPNTSMHTTNEGAFVRSDLNWVHKLGGSAKLDTKIGFNYNTSDNSQRRRGGRTVGEDLLDSRIDTDITDKGLSTTGKYTTPIMEGHALAMGWDGGYNTRHEDRVQQDQPAAPQYDVYEAKVARFAAFAQDEWSLTKQLSVYLGARWEGIRTTSTGSGFADSTSRLSVWSPVAQVLYRLPNSKADQLRLALTRTFKAPGAGQLIPRRTPSINNSELEPDTMGNPGLKPEQATGIDASYEHYWPQGGVFSVAASARRITDFTRQAIVQADDGRWVSMPVNDGTANTRSLEIEAKFPVKIFFPDGPALDVRANLSRNWSSVDAVPGPNNRLDQQTPLSATLGLDYKLGALTMGGSYVFRNGGPVRISATQAAYQTVRRDVDVYGLWKFDPKNQLRVTIGNVLAQDWVSESFYEDARTASHRRIVYPGTMLMRVMMEMKF